MLVLVTVGLAVPAAADTNPVGPPQTFFFDGSSGQLILSPVAPLADSNPTWTRTGYYSTSSGLSLRIPVENPLPELLVEEEGGVDGMIQWSYTQKPTTSIPFVSYGYGGQFSWYLVEGGRSVRLSEPCTQYDPPNHTYRPCEGRKGRYNADFPGHAGEGTPHSHHQNGTLRAGEFGWVLEYKIPPCAGLLCVPATNMQYTFSVKVDGTTFVHFDTNTPAVEADAAPEEEPCHDGHEGNETAAPEEGNETGNSQGPPADDNSTTNETGNESASSFGGTGYRPRDASGTAPGVPVLGVLVAGLACAWIRRRNAR